MADRDFYEILGVSKQFSFSTTCKMLKHISWLLNKHKYSGNNFCFVDIEMLMKVTLGIYISNALLLFKDIF